MRISLGVRQYVSALYWGTDRHKEYLRQAEVSAKRRIVTMPPAGWETLVEKLGNEAFTRWGKGKPSKLTGERSGTRAAAHTIAKRLTMAQSHPALRGMAVLGYSEEVFCVWRAYGNGDWQLTPRAGVDMRVLIPVFDDQVVLEARGTNFRTKLTTWREHPWSDEYLHLGLFPPEEHSGWVADADEAVGA